MGCLGLLLPVILALTVLLLLVFFDVVSISFGKLGLSPSAAGALLVAMLVGSMINIPVSTRRMEQPPEQPRYARFFYYLPPRVTQQTVAVNVGGALIPVGFALYLLPRAPLWATVIATLAVTVVARLLARPVPGIGIVMPAWIPPLVSAGLAFLLARSNPAPVAYISGTLGTLIGADLLNWRSFSRLGAHLVSIGGAGVFDGIFFAGILAVLIA